MDRINKHERGSMGQTDRQGGTVMKMENRDGDKRRVSMEKLKKEKGKTYSQRRSRSKQFGTGVRRTQDEARWDRKGVEQ